ncbi:MAG: GDSL-type esterase/lipase family protein [Candidatus Pacearchaeota archaeon]|nr:GDSL-type esterase/lipase family protein [Candidatus Pacearchaeota archaeon]
MKIIVFGDSIAYGAWDKEGGWVARLRKFLDKITLTDPDFYCVVYNCSVPGNTTKDIIKRFKFETIQRLKEKEDSAIIFDIGINDALFNVKKKTNTIKPEGFRKNIKKLINQAKKFSLKIAFISLKPVDEKRAIVIPWQPELSYQNKYIKQYNQIIKEECQKNRIYFIDVFETIFESSKNLLEDGIHPNAKGHELIYKTIKEFLIKNKIIELP